MRRPTTLVFSLGFALATVLGGATTALALWASNGAQPTPTFVLGGVSLAAWGQTGTITPQDSQNGAAVTLTLPGSDVAGVLNQTGLNPPPIIWRFTVEGSAEGIAGLDFDVTVASQVYNDGTASSIDSGVATHGTLLAVSTMKVYAASVNGDCSAVPAAPGSSTDQNVYVFEGANHTLQAPGAFGGSAVTQTWCVALNFNNQPDALYANGVQAIGTGDDATVHGAFGQWNAVVAFPPSLDLIGTYVNEAEAEGTADDGTLSRATTIYSAGLYPDPNNEPDVTIVITPKVTSLNPPPTTTSSSPEP